jgi:protein-tyrosine phosphatase
MDFDKLTADTQSQKVTGYLPDGRYIDIPLVSHVVDNLYVGGYDFRANLGDFFSHVFSLYKWESYTDNDATGPDTVHKAWTMYDSPRGIEIQDLDENPVDLDEVVYEILSALNKGGNVLVHCQAGINRSNLLTALVLRAWKKMSSREAIDLLREKRSPLVLANRTFESYLLGLDA